MDVLETIKRRRSIRVYQDKPIAKDALQKLVDAARFAATARDVQPWKFVAVTKPETLKQIADLVENGRFISGAGACIVVFCDDTKYYLEDGCAATQNILIAAAALGIGSCWVAGDKKPYAGQVNSLLGAPDNLKLVSIIALGYPLSEGEFRVAEKKKVSELIHWEKF